MLQYAQKSIKKSTHFSMDPIKGYILGLLLSTGKKNCVCMSSDLGVSYNSIHKYFDEFEHKKRSLKDFLIAMVNLYGAEENQGTLIIDATQIQKLYAKNIGLLCYDFNNSIKRVTKGLTCVTAAWTNGKILIPLDFDFWVREKDLKEKEKYKKKTTLTKNLILELKDKIAFAYISLDGEYGHKDFLKFLHENTLYYSIRMPRNRKVTINALELKLNDQPKLKQIRNSRYKTAKGTYKGIPAFFTSHKRKGKNGTKQVVFIVSNLVGLSPKEYVQAYSLRWPVEKMFRTLKQSLGLQQCQSVSEEKQRAHIFATFLAFTELEIQKINKKKKSPEEILKIYRTQNRVQKNLRLSVEEGLVM